MSSQRDPRTDPQEGDVLRRGSQKVRIDPCTIEGKVFADFGHKKWQFPIERWRVWAANAEVVTIAGSKSE